MTLRLRNTLTRRVEPIEPLEPGRVRMYTCGPTVYRYAHVGNLRSNLLADLIRRALLYHGIDVLHVKNITDVGHLRDEGFDRGADPMLVQAGLESKTPAEIAAAYEAAFHADEAAVNILPAHVFPRATEHIPEMLALAEALEDAGYAYATPEGNVYYEVGRFEGYGQLSGNTLADLRAGHRGDIEPDKRDPADFALWKAAGEGRILKWPTARWGEGFPGLAPGMLGDGDALPRSPVRHPHRRHRQRLPASRGRDRPVDPDLGRDPGPPLGARRIPADGRQEDGQVGGELPARDGARRARSRSAGVPLPGPDLALLAQAGVLGPVARCGRGRARVVARGAAGAGGSPDRGPVGPAGRPACRSCARPSRRAWPRAWPATVAGRRWLERLRALRPSGPRPRH